MVKRYYAALEYIETTIPAEEIVEDSFNYLLSESIDGNIVKYEDHLKVLQELEREMLLCVGHLERSLATGINKDIINTFKKYKGDK